MPVHSFLWGQREQRVLRLYSGEGFECSGHGRACSLPLYAVAMGLMSPPVLWTLNSNA